MKNAFRLFVLSALWFAPVCAIEVRAEGDSLPDTDDAWFEDDLEARIHAINEGDLAFIPVPPDATVLTTVNTLTVTAASIRTGWVKLHQCQTNLDAIPLVEVEYRYGSIRDLHVVGSRGIGSVEISGHSVRLTDVTRGAGVCMQAEVRILNKTGEGNYELRSGPFHRRFLDGYFPLHLQYKLDYPASMLEIESVLPRTQKGFDIAKVSGRLEIDAWFEGRLTIAVRFHSAGSE